MPNKVIYALGVGMSTGLEIIDDFWTEWVGMTPGDDSGQCINLVLKWSIKTHIV